MKKSILTFTCLLCVICADVLADDVTVRLDGPEGYEILALSKNGKYAVLYDGSGGGVWDVTNNTITYLGDATQTTYVYSVSDDGVVAGEFAFENIDDETSGTTVTGGIYKDGTLIPLLDEDGNYIQSTGYCISPNGKYVSGCYWITSWKVAPMLWDGDGNLIRRLTVENVQGCATFVTDDGVCGGWYYHSITDGSTNRQACIWTADNEIVPVTEDANDISGMYSFNGFSENGRYGCASIGVLEGTELFESGTWRKGVLWDVDSAKTLRDVSAQNYQVLNDGTVLFNMYADDTGVNESYMNVEGDSLPVIDYIEQELGSSLSSDLDPHVFNAYFSEDMTVVAGTSYLADGSALQPTVWISGVSEYSDVVNLKARTLPQISDKVLLRWSEPLTGSDNVNAYNVYARADSDGEWESVAQVEPDVLFCLASMPTATVTDTVYFKVTCVYDAAESDGVTASVRLVDFVSGYAEGPADVSAYVYNYNDVALGWVPADASASANVGWHDGSLNITFGANTSMTFQAGALFEKEITAAYAETYKLAGVQMYYNVPVDTLGLIIYQNYEPVYTQTIDQSALTQCAFNAIMLDSVLALPTATDMMIVVRVVQSDAAEPLGLDAGPAVDGGDMLSEDDGATWTTMRELSSNTYDYNFLIGMLLTDGTNPEASGYVLYRDDEQIATVEAGDDTSYEYIDKGVDTGNHTYTVAEQWSDGSQGEVSTTVLVNAKSADRLGAPVNVTAEVSEDKSQMSLTWEMPRQSEITFSNWTYTGWGTKISGYTGWFQGIECSAQKMKAYAGGSITELRYYPVSDCDIAIHIYEDGEEVGYMDIPSFTTYQMNTAVLDEPVEIKAGCTYIIALEGFDIPEDSAFIGNDTSNDSGCNVYSEDGETYYTDIYSQCNYMMGAIVTCLGDNTDSGITYTAYIDGTAVAEGIEQLEYDADISQITDATVTVNIGAVYSVGEKLSEDLTVVLDADAAGITNITVDGSVTFANGIISFGDAVTAVSLFNCDGTTVFKAKNTDSLTTASLAPGIYLLTVATTDGESQTVKISIP